MYASEDGYPYPISLPGIELYCRLEMYVGIPAGKHGRYYVPYSTITHPEQQSEAHE